MLVSDPTLNVSRVVEDQVQIAINNVQPINVERATAGQSQLNKKFLGRILQFIK